jgi:Glycosyl transferase family 2
MSSTLAPVALFIFNRPDHLRRTIESLKACAGFEDSPIFVFADGARGTQDTAAVKATRQLAVELLGERAEYKLSESNKGLARSIIEGVGLLLASHGRVIVVEDDLELAPEFLRYLNDALDHYADDPLVYQISGHMFDVQEFAKREQAVLLPMTTTWGWATWSRAWKAFDPDAHGWRQLQTDRALRKKFNLQGAYDYAHMLELQMLSKRQSWGIRWYWAVFSRGGLTCFPPRTLVANTGMDGTGTNGRGFFRSFESAALPMGVTPFSAPVAGVVEPNAWAAVRRTVWRNNGGWLGFAVDRARKTYALLKGSR